MINDQASWAGWWDAGMAAVRQMCLGLSIRGLGYHAAAWRLPGMDPGAQLSFEYYAATAAAAEAAKLDFIFLADANGLRDVDEPPGSLHMSSRNAELEPLTLLSAIAARTRRVGLIATASTTYNEPWHVARKFASLDHISGGRAGWNVVTSLSHLEARNFNRDSHPGDEARHRRAREFLDVVTGLWRSWDEDAFLHDKASGAFFDPAKLRVLDHRGEHFQVRGPLTAPRTPQGRPVLVQAGASENGRDLAAASADLVYSASYDLAGAQAYYAAVKGRMAHYGRAPDELRILPGIVPYVGRTRAEAQAKLDELQALLPVPVGLSLLYSRLGDLSAYDVDGPLPELDVTGARSGAGRLVDLAQREGLTIRDLYLTMAAGNGVRVLVGTPEEIADDMELWFTRGAADGFNLCAPHLPGAFHDFAELVLPELRRRGLFRTEYEGRTLREHLGIPRHRDWRNPTGHGAAAPG